MINQLQYRAYYATKGYEMHSIDESKKEHPLYSPQNKFIVPIMGIHKDKQGKTHKSYVRDLHVLPDNIYAKFLEILNPVYDAGISEEMLHKVLDWKDKEFREDLWTLVEKECLKFANNYGADSIADVDQMEWGDGFDVDEGESVFAEPERFWNPPTVLGMINEAIELRNHVINDWKYQPSITKRLNTAYPLRIKVVSKFKDITVGLTDQVWGSIWWSWFYSDLSYWPKPCEWCGAPILHDARASFCQPPRQCKNRFHNFKAKEKKKQSKNADK